MKVTKPQSTCARQRTKSVPRFSKSSLALAVSGALMAQLAQAENESQVQLDKLKVEEEVAPDTNPYAVPGAPYLAERLSDPRRTRSLAETPQTITVLTSTAIEESGRSDLRDILDGQPGITLGTGENGNAFGDRYVIRGHEARSDMFVDGLRDPGMTIRESFAIEQLEISKGPSSTFAGRGTTGGAVNSVSKRASTEFDFSEVSVGAGTNGQYRFTADMNQVVGYDTALRVNLLKAAEDVPDREPADRDRIGIALSAFHQLTDDFQFNVDYYHFDGDDRPDLGTILTDSDGDGVRDNPIKDIPAYLQDEDFLESTVDTITLRMGYEFSPETRVVNLTRYGTTDNGYVATGARVGTQYATEADATAEANGFSTFTPSTHQGWQEVEYFANQLSAITELELGGMTHDLVVSAEYSDQEVLNGVYDYITNGATNCWSAASAGGRGGPQPVREAHCLTDAIGNEVANINDLLMRDISKGDWDADWRTKIYSLALMDTFDVTDEVTVFGGIRYDYYDYDLKTQRGGTVSEYSLNDGYFNGHFGISYDVTPFANIYASYSTATNLNGEESDVGASGGYGGFIDAGGVDIKPERTNSYELGTKWRLNNGKLLATAALFRIDKKDVMESGGGVDYTALGSAVVVQT